MGTDFEVTMNEYLPLRDVVFNTLRQAILRGELKPGERLMEIACLSVLNTTSLSGRYSFIFTEKSLVICIPSCFHYFCGKNRLRQPALSENLCCRLHLLTIIKDSEHCRTTSTHHRL